jgi:hypothetical protein
MGRRKLETPNIPFAISVSQPVSARIEEAVLLAPVDVSRQKLVSAILFSGLENLDLMGVEALIFAYDQAQK